MITLILVVVVIYINECLLSNGTCEDQCINTNGSFHCECKNSSSSLAKDKVSCIVTDVAVLTSDKSSIAVGIGTGVALFCVVTSVFIYIVWKRRQKNPETVPNVGESFINAQTPVKYNLPVFVDLRKQLNINLPGLKYQCMTDCIKINKKLMCTNSINNQIIICDTDGTNIHHITLPYTPRYITEVDINTFAVSCPFNNVILIIDIAKCFIVNTIITRERCSGISYNYNYLYVVIGKIPHVMNLQGKIICTLPSMSRSITHITAFRDRLFYVDNTTIYCCSLDGKFIWKFENEKYKSFRRITTDDKGHVYVTDQHTNTVLTVSDDGKHKEILKESDRIKKPIGIYFDKKENILLVCNCKSRSVYLFDLTLKRRVE